MPKTPTREDLKGIARRAMVEHGLTPDFPTDALAEVRALGGPADDRSSGVQDLTARLWMSVDNESSRDLDQLSVAEDLGQGRTRLQVAVADVDALVAAGSAIDRHAAVNTTSVYTAAGVFSMIPERLSTDLTSLNQGEPRLALVVQLDVDAQGTVVGSDVFRARVLNRARLNYDAVAAWLEGSGSPPAGVAREAGMGDQIRLQDRVAQALRRRRHEHGALTLETVDATVTTDGDVLTGVGRDIKNRAKELIEDLMIAANTATATFLERRGYSSIRRVLHAPARWDRIVELARRLGDTLPVQPDSPALEAFLVRRRAADPEGFQDLSLSVVKLLGPGEYAVERPGHEGDGHFGLAVKDYMHSTAPNRRFADLVTHRVLKAAMTGSLAPYSDETLAGIAGQCTGQGNNANRVERQVRKSAAALLMAHRIGEQFVAIVTGASAKGTYVRLSNPPVEGRVIHGLDGFDVGDRVRVELVGTDVDRGYIDFRGHGELS